MRKNIVDLRERIKLSQKSSPERVLEEVNKLDLKEIIVIARTKDDQAYVHWSKADNIFLLLGMLQYAIQEIYDVSNEG